MKLPESLIQNRKSLAVLGSKEVIFGIRPEDIFDSTLGHDTSRPFILAKDQL